MTNIVFTDDQKNILDNYESGYASVLATPGSGKTTIIAYLIKQIIENKVPPHSILVLTLTESAAKEIKNRTIKLLEGCRRYPEFLTIHSFCNRILSKFYEGYENLTVLPDTRKNEELKNILESKGFIIFNEQDIDYQSEVNYLELFRDSIIPMFRRDKSSVEIIKKISKMEIKEIRKIIGNVYIHHLNCIPFIYDVINDYESFLEKEGYIDFDLMINQTLKILKNNHHVLSYLQEKYFYILEDESQDSNKLQSEILKLISGKEGNYLRVGDPNQSIFTTFTGADYHDLMKFYQDNQKFEISQSNRSHQSIIDVANRLLEFFPDSFPSHHVKVKKGLFNPDSGSFLIKEFTNFENELDFILSCVDISLKESRKQSFAILTRTNYQAKEIYKYIIESGFETILHGSSDTDFFNNKTILRISSIIDFLLHPDNSKKIIQVFSLFDLNLDEKNFFDENFSYFTLRDISFGNFLFFEENKSNNMVIYLSKNLFKIINHIYLPVSEILELINNAFIFDCEDKNVIRLLHQMWIRSGPSINNLSAFFNWLNYNKTTRIRQDLLSEEINFNEPEIIHILTIHKSKGLQWDNVFIPNFTSWDFKDDFWNGINEKKDIKSVILSLLEGKPKKEIRFDISREEIKESRRLAYVAITRAKINLLISYSLNDMNSRRNKPAEIFNLLKDLEKDV